MRAALIGPVPPHLGTTPRNVATHHLRLAEGVEITRVEASRLAKSCAGAPIMTGVLSKATPHWHPESRVPPPLLYTHTHQKDSTCGLR